MRGKFLADACRHSCLFYDTFDEQVSTLEKVSSIAVKKGMRCLYVASDNSVGTIQTSMIRHGGNLLEDSVKNKKLLFLGKEESYLLGGSFSAARMFQTVKELIKESKDMGFSGLVATGEMSWSLSDNPGVEELLQYESMLNTLDCNGVELICQYKRSLYPSMLLKVQERIHPYVFSGGEVLPSKRFVGFSH